MSLYEHIDSYDEQRLRSLFDMAAVAIVKDPSWASRQQVPAPLLVGNQWVDLPGNNRTILICENFDRESIFGDLFATLG